MAGSSELGPIELAPAAFGRRELTLAAQACDRTDRTRDPEHEQHPPEHLHGAAV